MLRPRWRKLCTELAHALRSHVISQHDNEVEFWMLHDVVLVWPRSRNIVALGHAP